MAIDYLDPEAETADVSEGRLTYLAFIPNHCAHCGADFNSHIPSGEKWTYYCAEWALREKWGR